MSVPIRREVHLERPPPELARGLQKWLARPDPGVIDEHVDAAALCDGSLDATTDVDPVGDVAGDRGRVASLVAQPRGGRLDRTVIDRTLV